MHSCLNETVSLLEGVGRIRRLALFFVSYVPSS